MSAPPQVMEFEGRFVLPASPAEVWSALGQFDHYEVWWRWLTELRVDGAGLEAGSVLHGTVTPPLPYSMRLRITLVECVPQRSIEADVAGDLQGHGHLGLEPAGANTQAEVAWRIEMMQRPLRLVAQVARPLLLWGQDRVVDMTVSRFRQHLVSTPNG